MLRRKIAGVLLIHAFLLPAFTFGQTAPKIYEAPKEIVDKIKDLSLIHISEPTRPY